MNPNLENYINQIKRRRERITNKILELNELTRNYEKSKSQYEMNIKEQNESIDNFLSTEFTARVTDVAKHLAHAWGISTRGVKISSWTNLESSSPREFQTHLTYRRNYSAFLFFKFSGVDSKGEEKEYIIKQNLDLNAPQANKKTLSECAVIDRIPSEKGSDKKVDLIIHDYENTLIRKNMSSLLTSDNSSEPRDEFCQAILNAIDDRMAEISMGR